MDEVKISILYGITLGQAFNTYKKVFSKCTADSWKFTLVSGDPTQIRG